MLKVYHGNKYTVNVVTCMVLKINHCCCTWLYNINTCIDMLSGRLFLRFRYATWSSLFRWEGKHECYHNNDTCVMYSPPQPCFLQAFLLTVYKPDDHNYNHITPPQHTKQSTTMVFNIKVKRVSLLYSTWLPNFNL